MNSTHPSSLSTPPPNYDEAINRSINEQTRLLAYTSNSNHQTNHHHSQQQQQEQAIDLSHETGAYRSPFQFIRLLGFFSLIFSTLFIIIISLSITRQSKIFNLNSYLFSHFSSFELPIQYSIISFLIIHLVLVNLNHSSKSFSLIVHHTIHITQLNILIQLFIILLNPELRKKESGLTLFFATILLGSLDLAKFIHSSTYSTQARIPIIIHTFNRSSFSFIRPLRVYLSRDQTQWTKTFKKLRFIGCSIFIILNTLILTISLLSKVSDLNPLPFSQLHTVQISLSPADRHHHHYEEEVIETNLQMKCEWLNQPNPSDQPTPSHSNLPIYTKTILLFSPSSYTAKESSNWISSIKSFHDDDYLIGIRFCQFDRPGYDHSFNLPINKISDSVNVMKKVLNQMGEIDQIQKNWQGIGHSGFIVVGHGYGALEAKVFVSKYPQLVKSILYIDPETEDTFFNLDQDLTDSPFRQLSLSLHHMYKIFISSWKHTITHHLSLLPIHSISPSMTRAIIQESSIASSILAYDEFIELTHSKHFPKHVKTKVISNPHQKDQNQFKGLEICIDFMQSTCQETLINLVNN